MQLLYPAVAIPARSVILRAISQSGMGGGEVWRGLDLGPVSRYLVLEVWLETLGWGGLHLG